MLDQLTIGEKASLDDFGASLALRHIGMPKKKTIKETVPFSNVTYDFTRINGETYWEERELEYVFEIIADDPEALEEAKAKFADWVMNVHEEDIHDPHIPDYHFRGTYEDIEFEDDEGLEKTTVTVTFTAYPYKIANVPKVYEFVFMAKGELFIVNESSHRVTPTVYVDDPATLTIGSSSYTLSAGTFTDETIKLPVGVTEIKVEPSGWNIVTVRISFREEVL